VVDDGDLRRARLGEDVRIARRDLRYERLPLHRGLRSHLLERLADRDLLFVRDGRCSHRSFVAQPEDERARVDPLQPDETALTEPGRPLLSPERAHESRLRVRRPGLAALLGDAVVADHRGGEADELSGVAGVGDGLLVSRHAGREDGLAEGDAVRRHRTSPVDGPVFENEVTGAHASNTSRPSATVLTTRPVRVSPRSHEFAESEWKPFS